MKTFLKLFIGLIVGIVCHILAFMTSTIICFGAGFYGSNSLWTALFNGILFGAIVGPIAIYSNTKWIKFAIVECSIIWGLYMLSILIRIYVDNTYGFSKALVNLVDIFISSFTSGILIRILCREICDQNSQLNKRLPIYKLIG